MGDERRNGSAGRIAVSLSLSLFLFLFHWNIYLRMAEGVDYSLVVEGSGEYNEMRQAAWRACPEAS